ncbi:PREDICTED: F-box/kelch-repeat protein At3g13680-like [Brassica oleracea var. oleracea]|uniref:F-box/kelch-repeat protein At3g13680-like n=1 Tax=Brassica oleracea var. oleracea TaxID=109376 RepID=UPI0006A6D801|nr:PREDICTED: F-box/kelch-repeat protein At3g13680-like [Brassica oleracea var. oleracea]
MTTIWDLPEDMLVEEIFSRVPLNYIKSVRSTCKKWNTLLRSRIIAISSPITGFEIYDFSSDSWNVLDVTPPPDWEITPNSCVSLKGNTYFCARRREVSAAGRIINVEPNFLVCFDFTTESFGPRLPLPFDSGNYAFVSLSCVREEQLAVLYQFRMTHEKIDIFVTNKISPSVVSWIKFIVGITGILLHLGDGSFFIDEETKLAVVFGRDMITRSQTAHTIETSGYSKSVLIGNASAHRPLGLIKPNSNIKEYTVYGNKMGSRHSTLA